jgi:hypothetical protein
MSGDGTPMFVSPPGLAEEKEAPGGNGVRAGHGSLMKEAHLRKVLDRTNRVRQFLLPDEVRRGEVEDPRKRLRKLLNRIEGYPDTLVEGQSLGSVTYDVVRFLETDMPEMVQAVRDANQAAREARRELARVVAERAGTRYTVTITSDSPIGVTSGTVSEPDGEEPE